MEPRPPPGDPSASNGPSRAGAPDAPRDAPPASPGEGPTTTPADPHAPASRSPDAADRHTAALPAEPPAAAPLVPAPPPGALATDRAPRPFADPTQDIFDFARDARWFAWATFLLGIAGVFLSTVDFVQRLIIIAPVFEELLKFGAALLVVAYLRIPWAPARVLIALAPGAGFGVLEHFVTYASEDMLSYAGRVAFHAGATAASMAAWCALEKGPDWRLRWGTTIPSTIIHAANNAVALATAIILAFISSTDIEAIALLLHAGFILATFVTTLAILIAPTKFYRLAVRVAPMSVRA